MKYALIITAALMALALPAAAQSLYSWPPVSIGEIGGIRIDNPSALICQEPICKVDRDIDNLTKEEIAAQRNEALDILAYARASNRVLRADIERALAEIARSHEENEGLRSETAEGLHDDLTDATKTLATIAHEAADDAARAAKREHDLKARIDYLQHRLNQRRRQHWKGLHHGNNT